MVEEYQRKQAIYGRLRSWGSFGWAVTTLISGRIVTIGGYPLLFVLTGLIWFECVSTCPGAFCVWTDMQFSRMRGMFAT
ncbi:MAG: hypothetical protein HC848_08570 [Limnobacter sp.]|nr:hypothetical protein [Limnobacter sp.]